MSEGRVLRHGDVGTPGRRRCCGRGAGCPCAEGRASCSTCVTSEMEEPQRGAACGYNQKTHGEQQSKPPRTLAPSPGRAFLSLAFN